MLGGQQVMSGCRAYFLSSIPKTLGPREVSCPGKSLSRQFGSMEFSSKVLKSLPTSFNLSWPYASGWEVIQCDSDLLKNTQQAADLPTPHTCIFQARIPPRKLNKPQKSSIFSNPEEIHPTKSSFYVPEEPSPAASEPSKVYNDLLDSTRSIET